MGITNNMLIFHIRCKKKEKGIITEKIIQIYLNYRYCQSKVKCG